MDYLADRGIEVEHWNPYQLGVVSDPELPEHEPYVGWITIPYLRPDTAPEGMKFRRPPGHEHGAKYMSHPGSGQRLYNTSALFVDTDCIGITEGEFDAIVATQAGVPSVAVPGANSWKSEWAYLFEGFSRVLVFGDGDNPGRAFADQIAGSISGARAVRMPEQYDVTSLVVEMGENAFRARAGV